jgi:hypothetical protein
VPVVQVVERVVEVLKEVPIEVVKEVPVYVKQDVSDMEQFSRNKGSFTQTGAQYSHYTGGTQAVAIQQQYDQSRSGATFLQQIGAAGAAKPQGGEEVWPRGGEEVWPQGGEI